MSSTSSSLPWGFLFLIAINIPSSFTCFFGKVPKPKPAEAKPKPKLPWDPRVPRKLTENCQCGTDSQFPKTDPKDPTYPTDNYPYKDWRFDIEVYNANKRIRTCTGTLINERMILTSNFCLRLSTSWMSPYEIWDASSKKSAVKLFATKTDIKVYHTDSESYHDVEDIIYNDQWELSKNQREQPDNDVAIVVLDMLWPINQVVPICLPPFDKSFDPTGYTGYYYGMGGSFENDPFPEYRALGNVVITPGIDCDKAMEFSNFSDSDTLCIQYRQAAPSSTGGILIMSNEGIVNEQGFTPAKPVYLIGMASSTKLSKDPDSTKATTYFTNIQKMVPYLEFVADKLDARWCKSEPVPKLEAKRRLLPKHGLRATYDWEVDLRHFTPRDESLDCVCGIRPPHLGRVQGGVEGTPYEFPWLVQYTGTWLEDDGKTVETKEACGGSIINDKLILTAAHCVILTERIIGHPKDRVVPQEIDIYSVIHDFRGDPNKKKHKVKKVHYSDDYVEGKLQDYLTDVDFALIELEDPIEFSTATKPEDTMVQDVRPICLPQYKRPIVVVGKTATLAGWGVQGDDSDEDKWKFPDKMYKIELPILPLEACTKEMHTPMRDTMLCAGYFDRFKGSSAGDSGGPLIIRENGYWTQVGVVSFAFDPDPENFPDFTVSVYANVQRMLRFIDYYSQEAGAKWCKSKIYKD